MNVTPEQVNQVAQQLAAVAGIFSPQNAAAIALLTQTATMLNTLVQQVRTQTDATAQKVWNQVNTDFKASVQAFEASTASTAPTAGGKPNA